MRKRKPKLEISLFANNTEYKGVGETFEDALSSISPPEMFVTSVALRVTQGRNIIENTVRGPQLWKFFHAESEVKEIVLSNLKVLFGL